MISIRRILVWIWAFPATGTGLLLLPAAVATGGGVQWVRGAVEIHGGCVAWMLRRLVPLAQGASALTLGHVILGLDRETLSRCRDHEQVHVRQYERFGPLFIPLYFAASGWLFLQGRPAYRENPFEKEAFGISDPNSGGADFNSPS